MAPSSQTILQFMLTIVWTCLQTVPKKKQHPIFPRAFSTYEALGQLFSSASLVFAPGLFEVLNAHTPPCVSYYRTLSTDCKKRWAVYLILLEKQGHRSKIYIGSGTEAKYGASGRINQYEAGLRLPRFVEIAIGEGFVVTRKGLLCTAPVPSVALVPTMRALFIAIEATLTYGLWAMVSKKNYGFGGNLCKWDRLILEYDGCCTHCSLAEGVRIDDTLTAEQLEALAAEVTRRRKERSKAQHKKWRAKTKALDPEAWAAKAILNYRAWVKKYPERAKELRVRYTFKVVKERRHHCDVCDYAFTTKAALITHLKTSKHAAKAAEMKLHCDICDQKFMQISAMNEHFRSRKHAAIAASDLERKSLHCDLCNRGFMRQTDMTKHLKDLEHTKNLAGEDPFHCALCKYIFGRIGDLKKHFISEKHKAMAAEIGTSDLEKTPYHCELCNRDFSRQNDLSHHLKGPEHTSRVAGEIPYHCALCNYTFGRTGNLKKHLMSVKHKAMAAAIETSDLEEASDHYAPYHCELCNRDFSRQNDLSQHMRGNEHTSRVAGEIPFHCTLCNHTFGKKRDLKVHLSTAKHAAMVAKIGTTDWESSGST